MTQEKEIQPLLDKIDELAQAILCGDRLSLNAKAGDKPGFSMGVGRSIWTHMMFALDGVSSYVDMMEKDDTKTCACGCAGTARKLREQVTAMRKTLVDALQAHMDFINAEQKKQQEGATQ